METYNLAKPFCTANPSVLPVNMHSCHFIGRNITAHTDQLPVPAARWSFPWEPTQLRIIGVPTTLGSSTAKLVSLCRVCCHPTAKVIPPQAGQGRHAQARLQIKSLAPGLITDQQPDMCPGTGIRGAMICFCKSHLGLLPDSQSMGGTRSWIPRAGDPVTQHVFKAASQEHHASVTFCSSESKLHISTHNTKF